MVKLIRFFFFVSISFLVFPVAGQKLNWEFYHPIKKEWINFGAKGSIQSRLWELNELPSPFVGLNEKKYEWIEDVDWKFRSDFDISKDQLNEKYIYLTLNHLDTYVKVVLNGKLILDSDNAFLCRELEIKKFVKLGKNTIDLFFETPKNKFKSLKKEDILPAPNDVGKIQIASMCRKPQYQFGWDWSLRMQTIGFWDPIELKINSNNEVQNYFVQTKSLIKDKAELDCFFSFKDTIVYDEIQSNYLGKQRIEKGKKDIRFNSWIDNPKLWWPLGYGNQERYTDTLHFYKNGVLVMKKNIQFAIRKVELKQNPDEIGVGFEFYLNDKKVFCKGANVIPPSVFPDKIDTNSINAILQNALEAKMNMLRIWGGGLYLPDYFYSRCQDLGIMVWQDFMFACAMYPSNKNFLKSVEAEVEQEVIRLNKFASVIFWNGNNEVDVAWKNWGFQQTYSISSERQKEISMSYDKLFKNLIPTILKKYSNLPYTHTSPLSNWGKPEGFTKGTMHYWGVWHGSDSIKAFKQNIGRFNAEFGFQSFPDLYSVAQFSSSNERSLDHPVMKHHQKSYVGNGMIKKQSDYLFGSVSDFNHFVYLSQLTQKETMRYALSNQRVKQKISSGSIFWQFNDCWPAPSWSSVDFYGLKKALHYELPQLYDNTTIVNTSLENEQMELYYVKDNYSLSKDTVSLKIYSSDGVMVHEYDTIYEFNSPTVVQLHYKIPRNEKLFCTVEIASNGQRHSACFKSNWNNSPIESLKEQQFELKELSSGNFEISFKNDAIISDLWITSERLKLDVVDNFKSYIPGNHTINIKTNELVNKEDLLILFKN